MTPPNILAFAGSARRDSLNKKLIHVAAEGARCAGANVTVVDLADYPLPLYNGDLEDEQGLPENARRLKELFLAHEGLLIASPEYNSSFTPLLKNTIDWVSRSEREDESPLACYTGKIAGLLAASPGALGGLRGLVPLRMCLENINVIVVPQQVAVSQAHKVFNEDGSMNDPSQQKRAEGVGKAVAELLIKLK